MRGLSMLPFFFEATGRWQIGAYVVGNLSKHLTVLESSVHVEKDETKWLL
jgi:hypothetical protein